MSIEPTTTEPAEARVGDSDDDMTMAAIIAAMRLGEGEGKPIDQCQAAHASSERRVDERITPPADPTEEVQRDALIHASQYVVAVNLTGPGRGHRPRCALGVGVRLLRCAKSSDDLEELRLQLESEGAPEAMYILPTHAPVPLFIEGPPLDQVKCSARCHVVSEAYAQYWDKVDKDFQHRFEDRHPRTEEGDETTEQDGYETVEQAVVPLVGDGKRLEGTARRCPPHHAFFSVAFVPEVKGDSLTKSYTEPLLAVFGSFATEKEAEQYTLGICRIYPSLDPCVVQGGEWLYPRVLGEAGVGSLKTLFPNAAKLEHLVTSLQRSTSRTAAELIQKENLPSPCSVHAEVPTEKAVGAGKAGNGLRRINRKGRVV
jgi:hypothetical protein